MKILNNFELEYLIEFKDLHFHVKFDGESDGDSPKLRNFI